MIETPHTRVRRAGASGACRCIRSTATRASRPPDMLRGRRHARDRSAGHRHAHLHLHVHDGQLHARRAHSMGSRSSSAIGPTRLAASRSRASRWNLAASRSSGSFRSPTRHGMTIGELARLFNEHFGIGADARGHHDGAAGGARCTGTTPGLPWVMPSPNIPTLDSALVVSRHRAHRRHDGVGGTRHDATVRAGRRAVGPRRGVCGRPQCPQLCPASTSGRWCSSPLFRSTRAWPAAVARFTCSTAPRSGRC